MNAPFSALAASFVVLQLSALLRFWVQRQQIASHTRKQGWRSRARSLPNAETIAFAGFAAAILTAHLAGESGHRAGVLAFAFVAARITYAPAYLMDLVYLRGMLAATSFALCLALFGFAVGVPWS
ncbi:MAG: MAPEG family protein [Nannocystaceae bacterium]